MKHFSDLLIKEFDKPEELFFISEDDLDGEILEPRIPDNFFTKNGYEDAKTKRVCFAPTVDQCLMGLSQNLEGKEFFVYSPVEEIDEDTIYMPATDEVPDAEITNEIWITSPVQIKKVGKIKVLKDSGLDGHQFTYGDQTAELYDWDYIWLEEKNGKA